ncbi:hypothetical protein Q31b_03540 [Novipirellula aureliae]|uniref:Type VI secretion system component TssM1 N-terminal domain-containing protein n=1 Tax=Novipirellula aureliae TaxID=2527966 RepID=A0A5C6E665_9BACT|nr:type VI secretion protein IcmF/TssM N-terminal domain-containing protein [Novipirellula aureliae]TWU45183.1 hypothetical protein Q31b_03540 [Novipirellula aureliae]
MQAIRNFVDAITYPFRVLARIPSNVISSPRRMLGLSLQMRTAILLFIGLLIVATVWVIMRAMLDDRIQLSQFLWREFPVIVVLVLVIPIVVWYALKLWLEGEPSPYPEIDRVWDAALASMAQQSIDPSETPLFIVMGPSSVTAANAFMASSCLQFPVTVPVGPAPLHVFANQQGIYVVCTESCCLAGLLGKGLSAIGGQTPAASPAAAAYDPTRTMQVSTDGHGGGFTLPPPPAGPASGAVPSRSSRETMGAFPASDLGPSSAGSGASPSNAPNQSFGETLTGLPGSTPPMPQASGSLASGSLASGSQASGSQASGSLAAGMPAAGMQGTMMVGAGGFGAPIVHQPSSSATPRLDPGQSEQATAKLAYICRCIRRVRDPLAPINGALIATPFKLLADGSQEAVNQLQTALNSDLATLRGATRMRCSVTHIVEGMEEEAGFRELIRRVGTDRVATQRFGKGFGLWNPPNSDQLDALVRHACGAFEDWSYLLFREDESLSKRGNRHLYGLLCRIRTKFLPRLTHVIQSAYSIDHNGATIAKREPLLFSGCYFVANGDSPDRQAFLASVFRKSQAEEEELEWGSEAVREEQQMQTGVQILLVINGVLAATIAAMLIYYKTQS